MKINYLVTIFTFLSALINISQSSEEYTISFESNGRVYIKEPQQLEQQINTEQPELIRIVPVLVNNWSGGYNTNENETEINTENANVYYDRYSSHSNWTIKATEKKEKNFL